MATSHPTIRLGRLRVSIDLPHLAFATAIAGWAAWYCRDAWKAGVDIENLILILPASIAALILYGFVVASCCRVEGRTEPRPVAPKDAPAHVAASGVGLKIAGSMALLAGLAVAGPLIGFDAACFVYIAAMLAFLGERRIWVLVVAPLLFCLLAIYGFSKLLETPLPLVFFKGLA